MSVFSLQLTTSPASGAWSENSLVSYQHDGGLIHIDGSSLNLRAIRKAARQIDVNTLSTISLTGKWHSEQQWAFASSFLSVKNQTEIVFGDLPPQNLEKHRWSSSTGGIFLQDFG